MAKIKFGMMMTDARGKLGGQVFSKNRSGAYVRTKVTPVNPRSTAQQTNRSLLGIMSSQWNLLTEQQRVAWNNGVSEWQKTNVFGDLNKPTGKNLFTSLNKVLLSAFPGSGILTVPPVKAEFSSFYIESGSMGSAGGVKTIKIAGLADASTVIVRATPSFSYGKFYYKNLLRSLGKALVVSETGTVTFTAEYNDVLGPATPGGKVAVEVQQVAPNGQLSTPVSIIIGVG